MTLADLAEKILTEGGSDVVDCPDKLGGCVGRLHCGQNCTLAKEAHELFAKEGGNPNTSDNGIRGMLTTTHKGSFETIGGKVEYSVSTERV